MPIALLAALAGSLVIHAAALWLPDVELSTAPEPAPIMAELQPPPTPPAPPEAPRHPERPAPRHHAERHRAKAAKAPADVVAPPVAPAAAAAVPAPEPQAQPGSGEAKVEEPAPAVAEAPPEPRLPGHGFIRFNVYKGTEGLLVGRAEHSWDFADGHYRLAAVTETVGLAALFKPIRVELESRGSLTAEGLQPERFTTRRNGSATNENADFDWSAHQVTLGRDGSRRDMLDGAQDLLSFHYQFGYLPGLAGGVGMGVATGKKFENYRFETVGEEGVDTPAGHFRTVHVRVRTDSTTELWLAIDRLLLPVKIRYTDKKGESFEQLATELGI